MIDILTKFAAACDVNANTLSGCLLPNASTGNAKLQTAASLFLAIIGAVCLLVMTISGFRYIISRGDSGAVAKAKSAIIYSLIGLIISMSAFAIVSFVVNGTT